MTFVHGGKCRIGLLQGDSVVDLAKADNSLPQDMLEFLRGFPTTFEAAAKHASRADCFIPLSEVQVRAPLRGMEKVIGIGLNYADHARESGMAVPPSPVFFLKFPSSVVGPNDVVLIPPVR